MQLQVVTNRIGETGQNQGYIPLFATLPPFRSLQSFSYIYARKLSKPLMQMSRVTKKMMELDRDTGFRNPRADELTDGGCKLM